MITTDQIRELAQQAEAAGQKGVASVLYSLVGAMAGGREDEMAVFLLPFLRDLREQLLQAETALKLMHNLGGH